MSGLAEKGGPAPDTRVTPRAGGFTVRDAAASLVLGFVTSCMVLLIGVNLAGDLPLLDALVAAPAAVLALVPLSALAWVYFSSLLGRRFAVAYQFGKFTVIGASNTAIDLGVLNLLIMVTGIHVGPAYSVFKGLSFAAAMLNSFCWNKLWTFSSPGRRRVGREFATFLLVSGTGLLLNVAVATAMVGWVGPRGGISAELWANVSAVAALVVTIFWNFVGYKFFVFKR